MSHYDYIEEIQKFNPFHDQKGRFANSSGFQSYSANPNTKAGAMAIARSAAAGHGNTLNVHSQSFGENIRQNANWIGRGHQQSPRQQGNATLRNRVEPASGLPGASAAGASWQAQNQTAGRNTAAPRNPKPAQQNTQNQQQTKPTQQKQQQAQQNAQPQQQTPTGNLASQVASIPVTSSDRKGIDFRDSFGNHSVTKKVADDHYQDRVAGKDISSTFDCRQYRGKNPIDAVAEAQGWNKGATVTNDIDTFIKASRRTDFMLVRSVDTALNGQSAEEVAKNTMTNGDYALGGHGARRFGSGLYMVGSDIANKTGPALGKQVFESQRHSYIYGNKQMMATIHPNAKLATAAQAKKMWNEYNSLPMSDQRRIGDVGAYIASKGFDGAIWHPKSNPRRGNSPYCTLYNKSALIFYGGVATS